MSLLNDIEKTYKNLYPTGRAWSFIRGGEQGFRNQEIFVDGLGEEFVDGLGEVFAEGFSVTSNAGSNFLKAQVQILYNFFNDINNIQDQRLPDNDIFDEIDATNWERVYGIAKRFGATLENRNEVLRARIGYPNGVLERATSEFIQDQLRNNGFDVYVHENRFWTGTEFDIVNVQGGEYNVIVYNGATYNQQGLILTEIVKNNIDSESDQEMIVPDKSYMTNSFFIGGPTFPNKANVPLERKNEFRHLILRLKHSHIIAINLINYI